MEQIRRRKIQRTDQDVDVEIVEKNMPKTWRGIRLLRSREVEKELVQDRTKNMMIIGSDVEALYPSLEDMEVAEVVYKAIMESKVKFVNVDYREAVRYIAMNWSAQRCGQSDLRRVLPWRTNKGGVRPGVTGEGPMGMESGDCESLSNNTGEKKDCGNSGANGGDNSF